MILINGFIRYVALLGVFFLAVRLEGGHPGFWVFEILVMEQYLIFFLAMAFYMDTLNPQKPEQLRQTRFAGLSGAALATFIPIFGGLIHYLEHYTHSNAFYYFSVGVIGCLLHTTLIYFSFFHWAQGPYVFEGLAISQKFLKICSSRGPWKALWVVFNYLLHGVGILVFIGFLGIMAVQAAKYFNPVSEVKRQIWKEGREAVDAKFKKIEEDYIAKNCKVIPDDEKEKIENELKAQQDKIESEKIYKLDHGE